MLDDKQVLATIEKDDQLFIYRNEKTPADAGVKYWGETRLRKFADLRTLNPPQPKPA